MADDLARQGRERNVFEGGNARIGISGKLTSLNANA